MLDDRCFSLLYTVDAPLAPPSIMCHNIPVYYAMVTTLSKHIYRWLNLGEKRVIVNRIENQLYNDCLPSVFRIYFLSRVFERTCWKGQMGLPIRYCSYILFWTLVNIMIWLLLLLLLCFNKQPPFCILQKCQQLGP